MAKRSHVILDEVHGREIEKLVLVREFWLHKSSPTKVVLMSATFET